MPFYFFEPREPDRFRGSWLVGQLGGVGGSAPEPYLLSSSPDSPTSLHPGALESVPLAFKRRAVDNSSLFLVKEKVCTE